AVGKWSRVGADEALARDQIAGPEETKLLENYAGKGWGPVQLYLRLSPNEMAALRAGQELTFSQAPEPGQQPLPPELARGVLQSQRDYRIAIAAKGITTGPPKSVPDGLLPA